MGGTHETTKVKRELKLVSKTAIAIERAKKELNRKDLEKDFPIWLRDRFGEMLSKIDPIESLAIFGLTVIIKGVIDTSEEIRSKLHPFVTFGNIPEGYKSVFSGIPFWYDLVKDDEKYEGMLPDALDWVAAFGLAFVIARHGGALLSAGSSIAGLITGLLT